MGTSTASFGVGKREGHDASDFYARRMINPRGDSDIGPLVDPPALVIDQLFCQSSTSMEQIPDNCVALMVTSPPYNVGKDYDEDLDIDEYLNLLRQVFTETWRVLEPGGRVAVNVANLGRKPYIPLNQYVAAMLTEIGFDLRGEIIWQKAKSAGGSCAWGSWMSAKNPTLRDIHEYVIVASKGSFARVRTGEDTITKEEFLQATVSIWDILPESARRVGHPAPFPVELPRRLIELYTFEGDLVLDPFLGSGSAAVAAVETNRRYVGYELSAEYIALSEKRIREGAIGRRGIKA
ncbi:MAG: site-specific DNA-methyltransferase [Actinomycetota bacterium]|nr:site-specific DNA-methyltransferase [Actinomycetota bacterium]